MRERSLQSKVMLPPPQGPRQARITGTDIAPQAADSLVGRRGALLKAQTMANAS